MCVLGYERAFYFVCNNIQSSKNFCRPLHDYNSQECHDAMKASNPIHATLKVTQRPSWVHSPASYSPDTVSSLSMAFEDPDRGKLRMLLAGRYSYIHMARGHRSKCGSSVTPAAKTTPINIQYRQASPGQQLHRQRGRRNSTHWHPLRGSILPTQPSTTQSPIAAIPRPQPQNTRSNARNPSMRQGQESSRSLKLRKIPRPSQISYAREGVPTTSSRSPRVPIPCSSNRIASISQRW
jgi:hypothetical protein